MKKKALGKASNGEFRINIGKHVLNGKTGYKQFRLGKDPATAERLVTALQTFWENETATTSKGEKVWSQQGIDAAFKLVIGTAPAKLETQTNAFVPTPGPTPVFPHQPYTPPAPIPADITLYAALELFDENIKLQVVAKEISESNWSGMVYRIRAVKRHIKDVPLHQVDHEQLWTMRRAITARPLVTAPIIKPKFDSEGKPLPLPHPKPQHPISVDTVFNWLMTLGMAFDFFSRTKRIGWKPEDAHWREAFCLTKSQRLKLMTPGERDGFEKPKPTYTLSDLTAIYKLAMPYDRMLILMGITLGWTQKEIATFRKPQFVQINGEYFIDKRRNKTGNEGFWWVCPELAERLIANIAGTPANPDDLALLTYDGNPLVHGNSDNVHNRWDEFRKKIPEGIPSYSFSRLRKLAGQMVENVSGSEELAQVMMNQRSKTVARKNYIGLGVQVGMGKTKFERLHEVQRDIHKALKPMFDAAIVHDHAIAQKELARKQKKAGIAA